MFVGRVYPIVYPIVLSLIWFSIEFSLFPHSLISVRIFKIIIVLKKVEGFQVKKKS